MVAAALLVTAAPSGLAAENCGSKTCDSSGNGHALTENGNPQPRDSPEPKYATGYELKGATLSQTSLPLLDGNLSLTMAFEVDRLPNHGQTLIRQRGETPGQAVDVVTLAVNPDGTFRYVHDGENGDQFPDSADVNHDTQRSISTGFHTLTLQRDVHENTLDLTVDGEQFADLSWGEGSDPMEGPNPTLLLGGHTKDGGRQVAGAVHEVRVWDQVVADETLAAIADPKDRGDAGFQNTPEGNETGLWFLGPGRPDEPVNLTADPGPLPGQVSLDWEPPRDHGGAAVTEYTVFRSDTHQGNFSPIATVDADQTSYTDRDRPLGQEFHYKVLAINPAGDGPRSDRASALGTGVPTVSPLDTDGDGHEALDDNCPGLANPDQRNSDGGPLGDACDPL